MQFQSGRTAFSAFPGSVLQGRRKGLPRVPKAVCRKNRRESGRLPAETSAERRQQIFGYRKKRPGRQPPHAADGSLQGVSSSRKSPRFFGGKGRRTSITEKESDRIIRQGERV